MSTWKGIEGKCYTPDAFDAYVKNLKFVAWKPKFVVLHNTGVPKFSEWHKHSGHSRMKGLEHYYRDKQKWSAGPHLFVADDYIWTFTRLTQPGVHAPSWNHVAWGVEMVGDYDSEPFHPRVRANAIRALAALHRIGGLDPATLRLHKEDVNTTHKHCPGKHVSKVDIITSVKQYLSFTKLIEETMNLVAHPVGFGT